MSLQNRRSIQDIIQKKTDEQKMSEEKIKKMLEDAQKFFSQFVLNLEMNIGVLKLKINNNENEEVLVVKYGNEEIIVNIDLVFKERTFVKFLGLEIESRHGFNVFMSLAKSIMNDLKKIKEILDN